MVYALSKNWKIIEYNRANNWKRLANYVIDRLVCAVLMLILGITLGIITLIFGLQFFQETETKNEKLFDILLTLLIYSLYMFGIEYFTKGRSIGKFVTGTKVVTENGGLPSAKQFFIRSVSRIVPFDGLSFLFAETGWHDSWSGTRVVNLDKFEYEMKSAAEIEEIGKPS